MKPRQCLVQLHQFNEIGVRGIAAATIEVMHEGWAPGGAEHRGVAAELHYDALPRSAAIAACADDILSADCLLAGGDDYELAFTAPPFHRSEIEAIGNDLDLRLTRIGMIVAGEAGRLSLRDSAGKPMPVARTGFDHFA